ncbi:hypothetical protein LKMONMHP_4727 [Methylobacterium organophilum]|uniref:Uncharacterized protein n=1 Tax=Methylobacterium organophilum TaxID=410 RepID=A0ABQ4TDS2_METOR|nr:hypothetical protein LKMONMHP_4727 [Methylobacterium organophilum]
MKVLPAPSVILLIGPSVTGLPIWPAERPKGRPATMNWPPAVVYVPMLPETLKLKCIPLAPYQ